MVDTYQSLADDYKSGKINKEQYTQRLKAITNINKKQAEYQQFKEDLKSTGKALAGGTLMGAGSLLPSAVGGAVFGAGDAIANNRSIAKEAATGAAVGAIVPKAVSSVAKATGADKLAKKFASSTVGKALNTDISKLGSRPTSISQAQIAEQIKPKTEVNIPSIKNGKTNQQIVQASRQSEINRIAKELENKSNIPQKVEDPIRDRNLVDLESLKPYKRDISLYEYATQNPDWISRSEFAPYATSNEIIQYAKANDITPQQALSIYNKHTKISRDLGGSTGQYVGADKEMGGTGDISILHPDSFRWNEAMGLNQPLYEGSEIAPNLTSTLNHEMRHKLLLDLYDQYKRGVISPEGMNILRKYDALSKYGAYSESPSHALGSIGIEGNINIPEARVSSYNRQQPYSEFSNEQFNKFRDIDSRDIRQRAIDTEFNKYGSLVGSELEKQVDKYLYDRGTNRFGGYAW